MYRFVRVGSELVEVCAEFGFNGSVVDTHDLGQHHVLDVRRGVALLLLAEAAA